MTTPNLYQVKEMYYYRLRVPVDLQLWFNGQDDIKRSLKTKSLKQARRLLRVWDYQTEEVFTLIRSGMLTEDQIKKLVDNFKTKTLIELEQGRRESTVVSMDTLDEQMDILKEHESDYKEALATNDLKRVSTMTDNLIDDNELGDVSKQEYAALSRELMKKMIEVFQVEQQRTVGNYHNGYDDRPEESVVAPTVLAPVSLAPTMLSAAIDKYMEDAKRKEAANDITLMGYSGVCQLFLRVVGDMPVHEITRDTLRDYLDTLKKLPPNLNKVAKFKDKSIQQILEMNEGQKAIAAHTVGKAVTTIKTLFAWMVAEELIDKNISGVLVPPKKEKAAEDERKVYTKEDLQRLVEGLKAEAEKGELKDRPERYWIPLIGLFSGMRLNEICQLHIEDVVEIEGVWCFSVKPDDDGNKQVKTAASIRIVPVHNKLIELGFIDYFKRCKELKQPRLWMRLTLDSRGKFNRNFSEWFLKSFNGEGFVKQYITRDAKKDFHSLRHTFINTLKQSDVEEIKISQLVGHTNSSMTTGRYGKRYEIAKMKDTINSLKYEGVDFTS